VCEIHQTNFCLIKFKIFKSFQKSKSSTSFKELKSIRKKKFKLYIHLKQGLQSQIFASIDKMEAFDEKNKIWKGFHYPYPSNFKLGNLIFEIFKSDEN
jgi:hypothetical protein